MSFFFFHASTGPAATKLAFTAQPPDVAADESFSVTIEVQNASGNKVASYTGTITVALTTPGGATLAGTLSGNAAGGELTLTGLSVDEGGTYTLTATAAGLTNAVSDEFTIAVAMALDDLATAPACALSTGRRLFTSYENAIVRLRRSSDDAESDFSADANGVLDTAAIATWAGADTVYLVTIYDQSGNELNVTQATTTKQWVYSASVAGLNGKPGFLGDTTDYYAGANPVASGTGAFTAYLTSLNTDAAGGSNYQWGIGNSATNGCYLLVQYIAAGGDLLYRHRATQVADATQANGPTAVTMIEIRQVAGNERYIRFDGANEASNATTVTTQPSAMTGHYVGTGAASTTTTFVGYMPEVVVFDGDLPAIDADDRNLIGAAAAYYGADVAVIL
ncbi:MAG: arabinofuranosidase catalytic domain-containing protein [Planctomycetota bacterium]